MSSIFQKTCLLLIIFGLIQAQMRAPQGPQGPKGVPGPTGATGEAGPKGDTGIPGAAGQKGELGPVGGTGPTGATGLDGAMGEAGVDGDSGVKGDGGKPGDTGVRGERGEMGPTGATGVKGLPGFPGPKGNKGARGEVGVQGTPGEVGDKGSQGVTGVIGPYGVKGDNGPNGSPGLNLQEQDVDECASVITNQCDPATTICVNLATGYECMCKLGYTAINGTTIRCKDVNECSSNNGDCAGTCTNTRGSFGCTCPVGTLLTANNQCSDKNECIKANPTDIEICGEDVNTYCINTYTSYTCASSKPIEQESTTGRAPAAQALSLSLVNYSLITALIAWLSVLTFIAIVVLFWLIYVFQKMQNEKQLRKRIAAQYSNRDANDLSDEEDMAEGMAALGAIDIDIPHLPRSQRGTIKGKYAGSVKGSKSYKGSRSNRPASVSSSTGDDLRTASVRQHRVATGERNAANRLSGVDTFY